jgi:hypothetical protein
MAAVLGSTACTMPGGPAAATPVTLPDQAAVNASTSLCVNEINRLRGTVGLAALASSSRIGAFSNDAAQVDGQAHVAHMYFRQTNGGNGTARAETMIEWWNVRDYGTVEAIVRQGVATMWGEGPGGIHFDTITGPYTEIGCGIFVAPDGEVTVSQDFR